MACELINQGVGLRNENGVFFGFLDSSMCSVVNWEKVGSGESIIRATGIEGRVTGTNSWDWLLGGNVSITRLE